MTTKNTHSAPVVEKPFVVRSVRYDDTLYQWLLARSKRNSRSIQRENTFLLQRIRSRPDLLKILDESAE